MKKIALVSHCVLNSLCELPEASDTFRKQIVNLLTDKKISLMQLPCPELCYQALERESITAEDPKAEKYEQYCRELLVPVMKDVYKRQHQHSIDRHYYDYGGRRQSFRISAP